MKQRLMHILAILWLGLATVQTTKAQIIGIVVDTARAPLPMVQIFNRDGAKLGQTRLDGYFNLNLRTGSYKLIFSHPDFYSVEIPTLVTAQTKDTLNIILVPKTEKIQGAEIRREYKDPAADYMRKAIAQRDFWHSRIPNQSAQIYIKAFEITEQKIKPKSATAATDIDPLDAAVIKNTNDPYANTVPVVSVSDTAKNKISANAFVEIAMQRDASTDGKIKETRNGVQKVGSKAGLFYLSTTEGDFNLYQNLLDVPALCPLPIMSPLSNSALLAYRFKFLGAYQHPLYGRVLRIGMTGKQTANATLSGELHLVDTTYWILKAELKFPRHLMAEYDAMTLIQHNQLDSQEYLLIDSQRFNYSTKYGKSLNKATTLVDYKSITVVPNFPKNHFGMEVSKTTQEAYERDSTYWQQQRTQPLSNQETKFINTADSIKRVVTSDKYLDSVEAQINKVTLKSLVLEGQGYRDRKKGITLRFQPLWNLYQPWWPGGGRLSLWNSFDKTFENKKTFEFNENLSYGINNKDVRGTVYMSHMYNPYKRALIFASVGRDFGMVNMNAAYIDLFRRDNFYQNKHINVYHRQELINGLFLQVQGELSDRKDMSTYVFDEFGDSLFENNRPLKFIDHRAFFASFNLSYTPFQRYMSEPKQKVILGSAWPTFSINYKQAVPGVFKSNIDYQYLEYRIDHSFPWGLLGTSDLRAVSGSFLSSRNVNVVDYRYQRRADPVIFTPPMFAFQQLDSTFTTFKRFYEVHYQHSFNGSLVNKIPFLKKLSLYEKAGVNMLYAPERRNLFFYEGYVGIDKLVRLWRDRYKIGIYYTAGYANLFEKPRYGFKINFEYYDRLNNKW
ncbi:MAG: hypothetical protein RLZZ512_1536 [Bacteroidota bacterium]|jgi:hypothetical protein